MNKTLFISILLLTSIQPSSFSSQVSSDEAIHVILGAASDETYKEMFAIAKALRNRGAADVAESVSYIDHLPQDLKDLALRAWVDSEDGLDPTNGANAWMNEEENGGFIRPPMVGPPGSRSEFTVKIGRHNFYRIKHDE